MKTLGITALIDFTDWDSPGYSETGGVNSVIKNIIPFLEADKIMLYGITYRRELLFREQKINDRVSAFPLLYRPATSPVPNRVLGFAFGWRLKKYLRQHAIRHVYSHSEELGYWLPYAGVPYVHHLHTHVNALEVSNGILAKVGVFRTLWSLIRKRVITRSAKSIAVNKEVVAMLEPLIGRDRIIRFSNYVDAKQFTFRQSHVRRRHGLEGKRMALFIGRITKVKGLELFVDTVIELNRIDGGQWTGVVVGNGEYEAALKEYIALLGQENNIILPGSVNSSVLLSEYYSAADVFLITSSSESVPLTLLESLSCGTPVVSTPVGIAPDVLGENNGFVAAPDKTEFAKKVMASLPFKSEASILRNASEYSVEHASGLLNNEFSK